MGRKRKLRRQPHGSAWLWRQTNCWYYTLPGCKKRLPLFDEQGERIRGQENKDKAELALARVRIAGTDDESAAITGDWLVARVCSEYLQYCQRGHRMLSGYWNDGAGCSIETLAELMGNTPAIAYAHYGREWGASYQDPLWEAVEPGS